MSQSEVKTRGSAPELLSGEGERTRLIDIKGFLWPPNDQLPESLRREPADTPLLDLGVVLNSNLHSALVPSELEQKGTSFTRTTPDAS